MKREQVKIRTKTAADRSGKGGQNVDVPYEGCTVWPRRAAEGEQGAVVLSGWGVKIPGNPPIPSDCLVVVRGEEYALFGKAAVYPKVTVIYCRSVGDGG